MTRVVSAFLIATVAFAAPAQRQLLDAGKGQRPFDVTTHSVPLNEIANGGPARDAIPALDHPKFVAAKDADRFLRGKDRVLACVDERCSQSLPGQDPELA